MVVLEETGPEIESMKIENKYAREWNFEGNCVKHVLNYLPLFQGQVFVYLFKIGVLPLSNE